MAFWSAVVKPGKPHAYVPPPEEWNLHLSQASLDVSVPEGRRVSLLARLSGGDEDGGKSEQPVVLCTLTAGRTDNMPLDLFFSQYAEFTVKVGGKGAGSGKDDDIEVHLSGYYTPAMGVDGEEDGEDEDEDEDEEYQLPEGEDEDSEDMEIPGGLEGLPEHLKALIAANAARRGLPGPGGDEEDGEDEDEDDGEDDDEDLIGLLEDEDEDEDMDDDEDEEMFGFEPAVGRRKPHVVIEEVVDDEDDKKKQQQQQKQQQDKKAEAKGKKEETKEQQQQQPQQQEKGKKESKQQQQQQQANGDQGKAGKRQAEAPAKKDETPAKKQAAGQDQPQAKPVKQQEQKGKQEGKQQQQQQEGKATPAKKNIRTFDNGFQIEEVSYGNPKGKLAKAGQRVSVRYVGRLKSNGKVFDKSDKKPFTFRLGVGEVIKGWDAGVEGMKVGDKRRLVIPPQMAYGSGGVRGTIPPNATLEFDVELVEVK